MKIIIAIAVVTGIVYTPVKTHSSCRDIRYEPCIPFLDSTEGQEYMQIMREYAGQHNGEEISESVRKRIIDEVLNRT